MSPAVVERFLGERRAAGYSNHRTTKGLAPLLGYLQAAGLVLPPVSAPAITPVEALLERYRRYLVVERGLSAGTVRGYVDVVRPFLVGRRDAEGLELERLTCSPPALSG